MRPARARINLAALRHNYRVARRLHGGRALAVLKANAYGHGAIQCAHALRDEADGFAVALLEEALALRAAGIRAPILVLQGPYSADELHACVQHDLWCCIHHEAQLAALEATTLASPLNVWLKFNTGMNRAGLDGSEASRAWARLQSCAHVGDITVMSHLARADESAPDAHETMHQQLRCFDAITTGLDAARSVCNSAGILAWPQARCDWARPGIMLYGADPLLRDEHELRAVMTLESEIVAVRHVPADTPVGYGGRFRTKRPGRIGLVALGYADGYPRILPDGTPVAVDGGIAPLAGRVSMDMLTVDLTDLPQADVGSRVELWGECIPVNRIAQAAGTIAYELLCNVKRVAFDYYDEEAVGDDTRRPATSQQ